MHFLFTLHPATGHLNPLVPLALSLQNAGHDVRLATAPGYLPEVAAAGLEGMAAGRDWLEGEAATTMPGFLEGGTAGQVRAFAEIAPEFFDDLLASDWRPDLVVRETVEFAGAFYADRLDVPCVIHGITIRPPLMRYAAWAGEGLRVLADHAGSRIEVLERGIAINHMPESWLPEGLPLLDGERFFAPCANAPTGAPAPDWLAQRDTSRPLVYATLGTVFNGQRAIFETLIAAAGGQDFDLLVTVGHNGDPDSYDASEHVHVARFVDQELILGEVAGVVCHGGMGTVMGALRHGVPLCIVPLSADQPYNALQCVALGCGRSYTTETPPDAPPQARPEDLELPVLREHIAALLSDPAYREGARRIQEEIAALPGLDTETELLVALASGDRAQM